MDILGERGWAVLHGSCAEAMRALPDASIDGCVCDPPYGLGTREPTVDEIIAFLRGESSIDTGGDFMGYDWQIPSVAEWREVWRVLKPGAHVLAFGGTRTFDLIALGLRAAGFESRDTVSGEGVLRWCYGQGRPAAVDLSKALDIASGRNPADLGDELRAMREQAGLSREELAAAVGCTVRSVADWEDGRARKAGGAVERIVPKAKYRAALHRILGYPLDARIVTGAATARAGDGSVGGIGHSGVLRSGGQTAESAKWRGWKSALKPAWEPILVYRKPLEGTLAENLLRYGTGAINVEACRIKTADDLNGGAYTSSGRADVLPGDERPDAAMGMFAPGRRAKGDYEAPSGRWPANVLLVHHDACRRVGTKRIATGTAYESTRDRRLGDVSWGDASLGRVCGYADADGLEEVDAWLCADQCPVAQLEAQGAGRARFYTQFADPGFLYSPKAPRRERDHGVEGAPVARRSTNGTRRTRQCRVCGCKTAAPGAGGRWPNCEHDDWEWVPHQNVGTKGGNARNDYPTVKPVAVMRWLVELIIPPGGTLIDPWCGSGTTGVAGRNLGRRVVLIDRSPRAVKLATQRMERAQLDEVEDLSGQRKLFATTPVTQDPGDTETQLGLFGGR